MTTDRSAKKAARSRMAATGEPYSTARRAVRTGTDRLVPLGRPPEIDPREHAVAARHWGGMDCYLVHYEDRHSVWITNAHADPADRIIEACGIPGEADGCAFLDGWLANQLLHTPSGETTAHIFLLSPSVRNGILYDAAVLNVEDSGFWLAGFDDIANDGGTHTLGQFAGPAQALEEFAAMAADAADRLDRSMTIATPELLAGVLRYRAATVRADAARAALGDTIRHYQVRADMRKLHPLWSAAGLSHEDLPRVLAGQDWTWPQRPVVRPPGSRQPDTPTTTLATRTVDGHRFDLVSYLDTAGGRCLAIERDGRRDTFACDFEVDEKRLANAAMTMATRGQGTAVVYGRVHDSVTELYATMKTGERVDWPIYDDPRSGERYFAVIADSQALADIVAAAPTGSTSFQQDFGIWFGPWPDQGGRPAR